MSLNIGKRNPHTSLAFWSTVGITVVMFVRPLRDAVEAGCLIFIGILTQARLNT